MELQFLKGPKECSTPVKIQDPQLSILTSGSGVSKPPDRKPRKACPAGIQAPKRPTTGLKSRRKTVNCECSRLQNLPTEHLRRLSLTEMWLTTVLSEKSKPTQVPGLKYGSTCKESAWFQSPRAERHGRLYLAEFRLVGGPVGRPQNYARLKSMRRKSSNCLIWTAI